MQGSISYRYVSWIRCYNLWMIYAADERRKKGGSNDSNPPSRHFASVVSKMHIMQHKVFWGGEFYKTESTTIVQRTFRFHFNV